MLNLAASPNAPLCVLVFADFRLEQRILRPAFTLGTAFELVVGGTYREAFERQLDQHQPPLVLFDLDLPYRAGSPPDQRRHFQPLLQILWCARYHPQTRLIALAEGLDFSLLAESAGSALLGYVLKSDITPLTLTAAIYATLQGALYLSPGAQPSLPALNERFAALTPHQARSLRQVLSQPDKPYAFHATALGITEGTLKKHLQATFLRLGVGNLAAAALLAAQARWISFA